MAWMGMNDDKVNAQGNILHTQAEKIQGLITKIDHEVESISQHWHGHDSQQFKHEWTSVHRAELVKAKTLLDGMVTNIRKQVHDQQSTSQTY